MQNFLALDIGRKHTGVAFADAKLSVPVPLETFHHDTVSELVNEVALLVSQRSIDTLIVGLPLLSHGKEGEQALFTREVVEQLQKACPPCTVHLLDERWTDKVPKGEATADEHTHAAVKLLQVFLERQKRSI